MKNKIHYILYIGLAVVFLSMSLKGFFMTDEIRDAIRESVVFSRLGGIPFFISFVAINDALVAFLLITRILPKATTTWAAIWIGCVIITYLTHFNLDGTLTALEHGAPFAVALFLNL